MTLTSNNTDATHGTFDRDWLRNKTIKPGFGRLLRGSTTVRSHDTNLRILQWAQNTSQVFISTAMKKVSHVPQTNGRYLLSVAIRKHVNHVVEV